MELGYEFTSNFNERYSVVARKIVRILSNDSRISISEMSKLLGMSRRTTAMKLRNVEKSLNLKYILELNEANLGFNNPHLIAVRFKGKPDYEKIKEMLKKSYIPQIVVTAKGTFDMLIYANAVTSREYAHWDKSMQILLAPYKAYWQPSEVVHRQLGFFPLRKEILERASIPEKYKNMLIALNGDARMSFQNLSKALNMNFNTAAYSFNKLIRMNYIERFTVSMDVQKELSFTAFLSKYIPDEGYERAASNARMAFTSDDENPLISRYLITAPLIGAYDFFTLGVFDNPEIAHSHDILFHKRVFRKFGIKMIHAELKEVLLGRLPVRSTDTKKEYKLLSWTPEL